MMRLGPRGHWAVRCSDEIFERQIADERLHMLLTLGRIVNALRFAQQAVTDIRDPDKPAGDRQRVNSFLFLGAILCEGMGFVRNQLGKHFRHLTSFKKGFQELFRDQGVEDLLRRDTGDLWKLRNKIVFHYDRESVQQGLTNIPSAERNNVPFVRGYQHRRGDIYFSLCDDVVVRYLVGPVQEESEFLAKLKQLMHKALQFSYRFGSAAEELITDGLKELGWVASEVDNG